MDLHVGGIKFLSAITRGDSNTDVIDVLVVRVWELNQRYIIWACLTRVPAKLNPPDLPTREKRLSYRARHSRWLISTASICSRRRGAFARNNSIAIGRLGLFSTQ